MIKIQKGYKQTEVGVIPEDWDIFTLEKLSTRIGDGIHSTPKYSDNSDYFFINGNNLNDGEIIISSDTKMVSEAEYNILKRGLDNSTLLISINGTIGNLAFYNRENIVLGKSAAYINVNSKLEKKLLFQILQTKFINEYFDNELTGSTIKNLGLGSIRNTPIPLPPTKSEQTAIATALNEADTLIISLEKLIEKKRAIKQGAMQELLWPKEGWEVKKLGEIAEFKNGQAHERYIDENGSYTVVNSKFVSTGGEVFKNSSAAFCLLAKGEIAMVMSDIPNGKALAKCFLVKEGGKFTLNQRICSIKSDICDNNFLFWILNRNKYFLAFDSGTGQTNLKKLEVLECPISLPPTKSEQTLIATILSDMDAEITALEQKLVKYKQIKQGMMQELLTGKNRLI